MLSLLRDVNFDAAPRFSRPYSTQPPIFHPTTSNTFPLFLTHSLWPLRQHLHPLTLTLSHTNNPPAKMGSSINLSSFAHPADEPDTDFQRRAVADLLGRDRVSFPGAQPVSFARHHLRELQNVDYFMCEKTDGIRCLLYLTQHIDAGGEMAEAQYLVDRKNEYYYVPRDSLHLPKSEQDLIGFHTGTLFDGELVRQRNKTAPYNERITYLIFDMLAVDGENITSRDFSRRLARIDARIIRPMKAFKARYADDVARQPFQIEMKKMELPYGFVMMFDHVLPKLPHGNDGLIFTCKDTVYVSGTDEHILKWKPPEENTVDFRLILGEFPVVEGEEDWDACPEMSLWVNHGDRKRYQQFATLHVEAAEWEAMKRMGQQLDGRIIEAFRSAELSDAQGREVWRPKIEKDGTPRFRDDKTDANHISVVESVLESIRDAVSEQDLKDEAYNIKKAFKERQAERERREADERRREREEHERRKREEFERRKKVEAERAREADGAGEGVEDDGPRYDDD